MSYILYNKKAFLVFSKQTTKKPIQKINAFQNPMS